MSKSYIKRKCCKNLFLFTLAPQIIFKHVFEIKTSFSDARDEPRLTIKHSFPRTKNIGMSENKTKKGSACPPTVCYIHMIPARGPQTVCLMQSLFCNHSAIFALQSFAMQSLLFCNLCYAIVAMQSLLCNLCYAIFAMQSLLCNLCYAIFVMQPLLCNLCYAIFAFLCFLHSDCKKHYKTCAFCNSLLKMLKNHWFSLVFGTQIAKNITLSQQNTLIATC